MLTYQKLKKIMFKLEPEKAHLLAECAMRFTGNYAPFLLNFLASKYFVSDSKLQTELFDITFPNPVGIAAGFDKNATMFKALSALGFGFIEYGTITPKPQSGNTKPRLFRYLEANSLQNAMGFNNDGMSKVSKRVQKLYPYTTPLIANIGKNKLTNVEMAIEDYKELVKTFSFLSDLIVINLSSPNTPGLRDLQNEEFVKNLFVECTKLTKKPILLKISPDLEQKEAIQLCQIAIDSGAKGIVATNTTVDYSLIKGARDFGGISGEVLKEKSFALFEALAKEFYKKTKLISVGGISSAEDVYKRLQAGASLVEVYSSFIFQGPIINKNINTGLLKLMEKDGFSSLNEVIGSNRHE